MPFWGVGFVVARDAVLSVTETKILTISPETFTIKSKNWRVRLRGEIREDAGTDEREKRSGEYHQRRKTLRHSVTKRRGKIFVENGGLEYEDNDFVSKLIADALRANSPKR